MGIYGAFPTVAIGGGFHLFAYVEVATLWQICEQNEAPVYELPRERRHR